MKTPNWTPKELEAYILLYCANGDFVITEEEKELLLKKVDHTTFKELKADFEKDNDYQSIQKIQLALKQHNYTQEDCNKLIKSIKELFTVDGDFEASEHSLFTGLKKIIVPQ